jgi:hypothetical protein
MMPNRTGLPTGKPLPHNIYKLMISSSRRKPQHKKHKTWDGDAYVTVQEGTLILVSEKGRM